MMRKFSLFFLLTAVLMAPQWSAAQLSVKFKTLRVNNITNNLTTPAMTSLPFDALVLSDVGLAIDVELVNDGDSAVNLYAETATIGLLYYDSQCGWRKIDRLDDRDCRIPLQSGLVYLQHPNIKAHTSVTIQRFWYYRLPTFYDISSLVLCFQYGANDALGFDGVRTGADIVGYSRDRLCKRLEA